ncbi:ThuA domain-containing protein [Microbispora corallina]|uniref:ThuA domain-containing protein n=1 Tax=Microbispora corallina TaxID=83302 RepID=UPI001EF332B6|nr:ThuA domain-containing protein [Microbispora corallina]
MDGRPGGPGVSGSERRALIVRGGWEGHVPVEATDLFLPSLKEAGFAVTISEDLDVYRDAELLAATDLIVQCWSMGTLTTEQCAGLVSAVHAGTGFAGWHGGVVGTFNESLDYLRMVGGLFLHHPPDFLDYRVTIVPEHADHPIVAGLGDFDVTTEQYWMLTDSHSTVLARTSIEAGNGGHGGDPVDMPVVWTRRWGAGKIFFSAIGHRIADLTPPTVRTLTERGLLWAAR